MPFGLYDSTGDDQLANPIAHLDWCSRNKTNFGRWDYNTMYISNSKVNDPLFPNFVFQAYMRKIRIGVAWSTSSEVDNTIAYNARQSDPRKKITHLVSEIEDYGSSTITPAQFKALMETNYPKAKAAGLLFGCYQGWSKQYQMIVANCDFLLLHSYITSPDYEKIWSVTSRKDYLYKYMAWDEYTNTWTGRLQQYALQAQAQQKILSVSALFSAELPPANDGKGFGGDYYKTHKWIDGYYLFTDSYNRLATPEMAKWFVIDGCYMFSAKWMKQIKP